MEKRRVIGLDFDDVLMDFNSALAEYNNLHYGAALGRRDMITTALEEMWGCTTEEANRRVLAFYKSDAHYEAPPVIGAQEAIKKLSETNDIVVVTSRPDYVKEDTLKWLKRHYESLVDRIHFTNHFMGTGKKRKKSEICEEVGVDIFVDDFLSHVNDIAESGREALLFDAPWNQAETLHPNIKRVRDWEEILKVLG